MTVSNARSQRLSGLHVALFTPLMDDCPKRLYNSIDYQKAAAMIDTLLAVGVDGFVAVATTGQSPTVSTEQHVDFVRFVHERIHGKARLIAGAGSNSTREAVEMIQELRAIDADMPCLCVTGYYNNPPQEGLYDHFSTLASETGAEIVLYNVPGRTGSNLSADTVIALAENPRIIGLKQAVDFMNPGTSRDETLRIAEATREMDFALISGEDEGLAAILAMGGTGIVSASANIPEAASLYLQMLALHREGKTLEISELQQLVLPYAQQVFCRKSPIPLAAMFASPIFQPMTPLQATAGGEEAWIEMKAWATKQAPSLLRWWKS